MNTNPNEFDAIVIGGSYAGLSAALQLARARRKVLVVDAGQRRNRFAGDSHGFLTRDGQPVDTPTCPAIWGECGTNGQHAYFQLLHQGTDVTPMDFIAALRPAHEMDNHHTALLANCFAQSEAFMKGKTADEVRADLQAQGLTPEEVDRLTPHKTFPGNRPSNTILMERLTPSTLGALIALYEHKTFVQGVIWDVNSFDQWGVELGKVLAKKIEAELAGEPAPGQHDSSTNGLIARAKAAF